MSKGQHQNFMGGAAILALAVAVTKVLGALYKIPLGNLLGSTGMAHFYVAYNIYSLLLVLSTAGLPTALSRMVAACDVKRQGGGVRRAFSTALLLLGGMGLVCSAVMCLCPALLANWLHDELAAGAIMALGPAVTLVCLTSALRGLGQGLGDMVPTAAGQVAESAGKLVIGLSLCLWLLHQGQPLEICAAGAIGGVTLGAALGLLVTAVCTARRVSLPPVNDVPVSRRETATRLLSLTVPITVGAVGMNLITLLDQALVTDTLHNTLGYSAADTAALYGEYTFGMTLFMLVPSFIYPLSVSLMPAVTAALTRGDRKAAGAAAGQAMKLTVLVALPAGVGLSVLAEPILLLLYPAVEETARAAAYHLTFLGLACVCVCLMVVTNGVLQAYGKPHIPVVTLLLGGGMKLATNYLMVGDPAVNIRGAAVSTLYCYAFIAALNLIAVARYVPYRVRYVRLLGKPLLITAVMALAARSGYTLLLHVLPQRWAVVPAILLAAAVYVILALATGTVTRQDVLNLPKGGKIAQFLRLS